MSVRSIADVQAFVASVVEERLRAFGATLNHDKLEDLHAYLTLKLFEFDARFDPAKTPTGMAFSTWCGRLLRLRVVDWFRQEFGDRRYGSDFEPPLSLDHPTGTDGDVGSFSDTLIAPEHVDAEPVGLLVAIGRGDYTGDCDEDLARLLAARDRERTRDTDLLRLCVAAIARARAAEQRQKQRLRRPALPPAS